MVVGLPLHGVRVFRQFAWLEVGSGKMALSRPTHQYPEGAYPLQGASQTHTVGQFLAKQGNQ